MKRLIAVSHFIVIVLLQFVGSKEVYEGIASVTEYANIALDLKSIEGQLAIGTQESKDAAFAIYTKGAYSMSYANVTLVPPLSIAKIVKGTEVSGQTFDGEIVNGIVMADAVRGDSVLQVQYSFRTDEDLNNQCFLGGIPKAITKGCFQSSGDLFIGQSTFTYSYNVLKDTHNAITLQALSTEVETFKTDSTIPGGRYFKMFRRYNVYYGHPDYANEWVSAAFSNRSTDLLNGNAHFEGYDDEGTAEAIVNGIAFLNVWMSVIRQMELARDKCMQSCVECVDDSVKAWDVAIAFYTGSLVRSPTDNGMLHYTLVETMCEIFGTCNNGINDKIYRIFNEGKDLLMGGNCGPIEDNIETITSLMTVSLVQGMLYEAYREDKFKDSSKKVAANGATFAAAVLPQVSFCNDNWARVLYENIKLGHDTRGSFEVVKDAVERQYHCMSITCEDVGGIVRPGGGYYEGAEPCEQVLSSQSTTSESSNSLSIAAIGGIFGGLIAIIIILALMLMRKKRKEKALNVNEPVDLNMTTTKEGGESDIV